MYVFLTFLQIRSYVKVWRMFFDLIYAICTSWQIIEHVQTYKSPTGNDLREKIRRVEARMLSVHAAALVGNQAMDFKKQDGVTEIEESLEANEVERRMNDLLFQDELDGKVSICRRPALIGCVSNFSNFLDLCRKCLRNLELGVPVVVLSRSNTTQHMYRWVELLLAEMEHEGLDTGLVTYAACSISEQRRIMAAAEGSPLYLTGSRPVAKSIKELVPATFSSTGGPNTMVATKISKEIAQVCCSQHCAPYLGDCRTTRDTTVCHGRYPCHRAYNYLLMLLAKGYCLLQQISFQSTGGPKTACVRLSGSN